MSDNKPEIKIFPKFQDSEYIYLIENGLVCVNTTKDFAIEFVKKLLNPEGETK